MEELMRQISEICQRYQIARTAMVVDDEWEQREEPEPVAWEEFIQEISIDSKSLSAFSLALQAEGHGLTEPLPLETVEKAVTAAFQMQVPPDISKAKDKYSKGFRVLKRLELILKSLDFGVEAFPVRPDLRSCKIPFLMLVDYHLTPESEGGIQAEQLFAEVMRRCRSEPVTPPPFVILMSQKLLRSEREKTLMLAEKSGFFRFNYEFVHKEDIRRSPESLYLALLNFCRHSELSRAYFRQVLKLEDQTKRIATETTNKFFQITPAEVSNFRPRMQREGREMAGVLADLFSEHVFAAVSRSTEVRQCMNEVDRAFGDPLPVFDVGEGGPLHRLYSELLFGPAFPDENSPPEFGDIYLAPDKTYCLVISQECDLATGQKRQARVKSVLLLPGQIHPKAPEESDGPIVARPFFSSDSSKSSWIWWNLMEPRAVRYSEIFVRADDPIYNRNSYKKIFRLRTADAESVQQEFAAALTRVGSDVPAGAIRVLGASVEMQPADTSFKIDVCVVRNQKEWDVALLKPTQLLDVPEAFRKRIQITDLDRLGCFNSLKNFKDFFKKAGVLLKQRNGDLIIGFGQERYWPGLPDWSGPL